MLCHQRIAIHHLQSQLLCITGPRTCRCFTSALYFCSLLSMFLLLHPAVRGDTLARPSPMPRQPTRTPPTPRQPAARQLAAARATLQTRPNATSLSMARCAEVKPLFFFVFGSPLHVRTTYRYMYTSRGTMLIYCGACDALATHVCIALCRDPLPPRHGKRACLP